MQFVNVAWKFMIQDFDLCNSTYILILGFCQIWTSVKYWLCFEYCSFLFTEHSWLQNAKKAPNVPLGDVVKSRLKQFSMMNRFKRKALRVSWPFLCTFYVLSYIFFWQPIWLACCWNRLLLISYPLKKLKTSKRCLRRWTLIMMVLFQLKNWKLDLEMSDPSLQSLKSRCLLKLWVYIPLILLSTIYSLNIKYYFSKFTFIDPRSHQCPFYSYVALFKEAHHIVIMTIRTIIIVQTHITS